MGEQNRNIFRIILSKGYYHLVKFLLKMEYGDFSIGTKGYRKNRIKPYLKDINHGSSYVIELIYRIYKKGKIIEIAVFCNDKRKSKFNIINETLYRFKTLVLFWIKK